MVANELVYVAFADDHAFVREGLISVLHGYGNVCVYIEATHGRDLIDKIAKADKLPDVVILDINMPEMNGFETQIELMRRWPDLKTLVLTAHPMELYIIRMIMNGAKGYMLKHASSREIERAILSIHRNGIYHFDMLRRTFRSVGREQKIKMPNFTQRELRVLKYCCSDLDYAEIAQEMGTTKKSVEGLKDSLFRKLKVSNRTSLALYAIQLGIVTTEPLPEIKIRDLIK